MQLDIGIDTPLLPSSIRSMLHEWRRSLSPLWYAELEAVYHRFSPSSWNRLVVLVSALQHDVRQVKAQVYATAGHLKAAFQLTRLEKDLMQLEQRLIAALSEAEQGPYRELWYCVLLFLSYR